MSLTAVQRGLKWGIAGLEQPPYSATRLAGPWQPQRQRFTLPKLEFISTPRRGANRRMTAEAATEATTTTAMTSRSGTTKRTLHGINSLRMSIAPPPTVPWVRLQVVTRMAMMGAEPATAVATETEDALVVRAVGPLLLQDLRGNEIEIGIGTRTAGTYTTSSCSRTPGSENCPRGRRRSKRRVWKQRARWTKGLSCVG